MINNIEQYNPSN